MDTFSNPKFVDGVIGIAKAYGGIDFWTQNLRLDSNPDATWRSLLVIGCLKLTKFNINVRTLLNHDDSRVRAWACFALGQCQVEEAADDIFALNADPSNRVRIHAWQAIKAIIGPEQTTRPFDIRHSPQQRTILISEDSPQQKEVLSSILSTMGFQTIFSTTRDETMKMALKYRPDALITDNQKFYDNLSGLNMTWDICGIPDLREMTIFMITADWIEPVFLWYGGDLFLHKLSSGLKKIYAEIHEYMLH